MGILLSLRSKIICGIKAYSNHADTGTDTDYSFIFIEGTACCVYPGTVVCLWCAQVTNFKI